MCAGPTSLAGGRSLVKLIKKGWIFFFSILMNMKSLLKRKRQAAGPSHPLLTFSFFFFLLEFFDWDHKINGFLLTTHFTRFQWSLWIICPLSPICLCYYPFFLPPSSKKRHVPLFSCTFFNHKIYSAKNSCAILRLILHESRGTYNIGYKMRCFFPPPKQEFIFG